MKSLQSIIIRLSLLFIILLLSRQSLFCQDYTPFDFENGIWIQCYDYVFGESTCDQVFCDGDTVINIKVYHKLYAYHIIYWNWPPDTSFGYWGAIANNTVNKKVEFIKDGQEDPVVLYDFDLETGDTIKEGYGADESLVVSAIDTIEICGRNHKRFIIGETGFGVLAFIEGIGCSFGFIDPVVDPFEETSDLICYTETSNEKCSECNLLVQQKDPEIPEEIKIYPNPASDQLMIEAARSIVYLELFSINGKSLFKHYYNSKEIIMETDFARGLYFMRIRFDNHESITKKIIIK